MSLQWASVTSASPVRVRIDGAAADTPATAPTNVGFAAGQRVVVELLGRALVIIGAYAASSTPVAQTVYVPGDDGSVWQVKASSSGTLYTVKVS